MVKGSIPFSSATAKAEKTRKEVKQMRILRKIAAVALSALMVVGGVASAFAADVPAATIDTSKTGSITLYKIDESLARAEGMGDMLDAYVTTGQMDNDLYDTLINNGDENTLGNGQKAYGYAIKGVVYSYLKVANIIQYDETEADGTHKDMILYEMDDIQDAALLAALSLTNEDAYPVQSTGTNAFTPVAGKHYFESDTLVNALSTALETNSTTVKNALEIYMAAQNAPAFDETNEYGKTSKDELPLGLYLIVETSVPEMVTSTTNPFFISIPMTAVNGGANGTAVDNGGAAWLYDITLFPKNDAGIPSLEKTVRESAQDYTGSVAAADNSAIWHDNNNGSPIDDGYSHNATVSTGDKIDYQYVSKLPHITSEATALTMYTFTDVMQKGIEFNGNEAVQDMLKGNFNANDVKIEFFKDAACTEENKVATWLENDATVKFVVDYDPPVENAQEEAPANDATRMEITMTAAGLDEINHANTVYTAAGATDKGYSKLYMRITYSATLNQNADVTFGDNGNFNTVTLKWQRSNMDYYDTLMDDCHVYTYGIDLTKQFSDGQGNFANVEFKLFNKTDGYWVTAEESPAASGIYYVKGLTAATPAGWVAGYSDDDVTTSATTATDESGATGTTFIPNATSGVIKIYGLEDDEYILTEVKTDNGYNLLKDNVNIIITATDDPTRPCDVYTLDENGVWQNKYTAERYNNTSYDQDLLAHNYLTASATVDNDAVNMETDNGSTNALVPLSVINTKGFDMPKTGADGVQPVIFIGVLGMAAAAYMVLVLLKKRQSEN